VRAATCSESRPFDTLRCSGGLESTDAMPTRHLRGEGRRIAGSNRSPRRGGTSPTGCRGDAAVLCAPSMHAAAPAPSSTSRVRNSPILGAFLLRRAPSHRWCEMPHEILPTAAKLEQRAHQQVDADRRVARFHLRNP